MRKITTLLSFLILVSLSGKLNAQDTELDKQVKILEQQKSKITDEEREALKEEVKKINERLNNGSISEEEARQLKEEAAQRRALNIENRIVIIDNKIDLLKRNGLDAYQEDAVGTDSTLVALLAEKGAFSLLKLSSKTRHAKKDKRTHSDLVLGLGFHNNIIEGQSFFDTPHAVLGSRYFELGILWKTRVFRNSNWLRLNYGFIYESKGLKTTENRLFIENTQSGTSVIELVGADEVFTGFQGGLRKSKVRQDDFIFPLHLEFGPSSKKQYGEYIRYSKTKKFKFGVGVYFGIRARNIQKIKFEDGLAFGQINLGDGRRLLGTSPENSLTGGFWGWSIYAGQGNTAVVFKLEETDNYLSNAAQGSRRNVSLGLRFDL